MKVETAYLNSNDGTGLVAFGVQEKLRSFSGNDLQYIQDFIDRNRGEYIFMMLSYELKNSIEALSSHNHDGIGFPKAVLWVPDTVIKINGDEYQLLKGENIEYLSELIDHGDDGIPGNEIKLTARTDRETYLDHVKKLKQAIQFGNIYEVNYCQEFYAQDVLIRDGFALYKQLNERTRAPFSAYAEIDEFILLCGSPERFINKVGSKLTSQPIKGTTRRGKDLEEDEYLKQKLASDPKERSENVMIVDLVRNDLSRVAEKGSVNVDELFGVYSFKTVHQLISTISCKVKEDVSFTDILRATFPMGSMTGAPKLSAMKYIEEHEDFRRGLYSGSIGYIDPQGDFDLNVIIRSMIYNKERNYLSCSVGGAITINSDPEAEYEECFTKISALIKGIHA